MANHDKMANIFNSGSKDRDEVFTDYQSTVFDKTGSPVFATKSHYYSVENLNAAMIETCKAIKKLK